jgi:hypothetical protein
VTIRVNVDELPDEVVAALNRGDSVEFEREGEVVGTMTPSLAGSTDWARFLEVRRSDPPLDYEAFLKDLDVVRQELNTPVESLWPS